MKVEKADSSEDFIKAKFVQDNKITELKVENKDSFGFVTFEGKDGKPDTQKLQCEVVYKGQTEKTPHKWTMNNKSRNALVDAWGDNTDTWVNKPIPITIAGEGEMTHILVDKLRIE